MEISHSREKRQVQKILTKQNKDSSLLYGILSPGYKPRSLKCAGLIQQIDIIVIK